MKKCSRLACYAIVGTLVSWMGCVAEAAPNSGLSFGLGLGAMVPTDDTSYMGIGADAYPELQIAYDIGPVNIGWSLGYTYRKEEVSSYYGYRSYYAEYTQAFVPVELKACIYPLRFAKPNFAVQPYIGIGGGAYIAAGDNENTYALITPQGGVDFQLGEHNVLGVAFAYHSVLNEDEDEDFSTNGELDLDYGTIMVVYRFRIPFSKNAKD